MVLLSNSSWRANAACMAGGLSSQSLVEPSMSVNRNVTVPVGGLVATTTSMSSLLPFRGHYSSRVLPGSSVHQVPGSVFAAFAEYAYPLRGLLYESVTDGARPRGLRSHNPPTPVSKRCCMLQNRLT